MAPPVTAASETLVVGAGPAGLATAIGLEGACTVLERRPDVGGLSASVELEGAVFDVGGHSFWTPHDDVRRLVHERVPMVEQRRRAVCWVDGQFVPYPFQDHVRELDAAAARDCERGLRECDGGAHASDLDDWIVRRFGRGIADRFLLPYNRKLWARDLRRLSTEWVSERVAGAPSKAEAGAHRVPLRAGTVVGYPATGGFGGIAAALARGLPDVRTGAEVERIDVARREVSLADGTVLPWERLVSTIALPALVARVVDVPASVRAAAAGLESVSLRIVFVVVGRPVDREVQRVYVADPAFLPHKIALNHNSSPSLRARPRHAIIAEIAYSPEKPLPAEDLESRVVEDLLTLGLLDRREDVVATRSIDVVHGYPVPTPDRAARVAVVRGALARHGVSICGRLGEWEYVNSDECIHRGLALGRAMAGTASPAVGPPS